MLLTSSSALVFFFNDTPPPEISPLPLHDALPICGDGGGDKRRPPRPCRRAPALGPPPHRPGHLGPRGAHRPRRRVLQEDRKSTRLNSSHANISYAVFCLKKKKTTHHRHPNTPQMQ